MDKSRWRWLRIIPLAVGLMSGILSIFREFLLFTNSRLQEATLFWASVRIAFVASAAMAWGIEYKRGKEKDDEIGRLSKPDDCPVLRIYQWSALESGPTLAIPHGFLLTNDGPAAAYDVRIKGFEIEPSVIAECGRCPGVRQGNTGNGRVPVWLRFKEALPGFDKWDLPAAFVRASINKYGDSPHGVADYSVEVCTAYRDHRSLWYQSIVEATYRQALRDFLFLLKRHDKLGTVRPDWVD